ncbi:MAG: PEGA domain-containing protein [Myxococcota bacterium]
MASLLGAGEANTPPSAPAPSPAAGPRRTVVVMPLRPQGVDETTAAQATELVVGSFSVRRDYALVTLSDAANSAQWNALRDSLACPPEKPDCSGKLPQGLNAELLVTGTIGAVGDQISVTTSLVRVADATVVSSAAVTVSAPKDLPRGIKELVARLMGETSDETTPAFSLPPGEVTSLAVLDLGAHGVHDTTANNLTQVLAVELKKIRGTSVIGREDVRAMLQLQAAKASVGCDDMACLVEIGGALGVDKLVTGSVGRVSNTYIVTLRLVSARNSRVENLVTESFSGQEEQLIRAVRRAGRALLGITSAEPGTLVIAAPHEGVRVQLDGKALGTTPLKPLSNLSPGAHALQVTKDGYEGWSGDVYVDPAETTAVWVELHKKPLRWYQRWWLWAGAGAVTTVTVGILAAVGLGVATTVAILVSPAGQTSSGTVVAGE